MNQAIAATGLLTSTSAIVVVIPITVIAGLEVGGSEWEILPLHAIAASSHCAVVETGVFVRLVAVIAGFAGVEDLIAAFLHVAGRGTAVAGI